MCNITAAMYQSGTWKSWGFRWNPIRENEGQYREEIIFLCRDYKPALLKNKNV